MQETVDPVAGIDAMRRQQISAIQKLSNYGASGSFDAGAVPGVLDLAA